MNYRSGLLILLVTLSGLAIAPTPTSAIPFQIARQLRFPLDGIEASEGRTSGLARGKCIETDDAVRSVVPLVPLPDLAQADNSIRFTTIDSHPTFYFFVPEEGDTSAQFRIYDSTSSNVQIIEITMPPTSGIVPIRLPGSIPALETGTLYSWEFVLSCDPNAGSDVEPFVSITGLTERVTLDETLAPQLSQSDLRDRPAIYADAGLWYDALDALIRLRYADPTDEALLQDWQSLLESVELGQVASDPLIDPESVSIEVGSGIDNSVFTTPTR